MCESLAFRRQKWKEKAQGRLDLFKTIRNELYQMEEQIENIDDLEKADKAKARLFHFWKIFEGTVLEMEKEKTK